MKRLTENEIVEKLKELEIKPFEINCQEVEPYLPFVELQTKYRPDLLVNIKWRSKIFRFVSEIKTVATPKLIDDAISQLSIYLEFFKNREFDELYYPMIVTPYLNERQIQELTAREISALDLSGNMIIIVPDKLFVCKSGNPNKYPSAEQIQNVYRWSSSIVGRVFLSRPEFATVSEVYDEIISRGGTISLGTVSKVLKKMDEDFLISRQSGIKLIDPPTLLSKLKENYRPKGTRSTRRKVADIDEFLKNLLENSERNKLRFAINQPQRYAVFPTVGIPTKLYLENIDRGFAGTPFEDTDRFANLNILETSEPSYYFDRQFADGTYYTSPVQTYLDLMRGGQRERDTAERIAKDLVSSLERTIVE